MPHMSITLQGRIQLQETDIVPVVICYFQYLITLSKIKVIL